MIKLTADSGSDGHQYKSEPPLAQTYGQLSCLQQLQASCDAAALDLHQVAERDAAYANNKAC
jgi:hypothetical protein